jgi:hypothetical protein
LAEDDSANFSQHSESDKLYVTLKLLLLQLTSYKYNQGDQSIPSFADWAIIFFGQSIEHCRQKKREFLGYFFP